MGGSRKSCRGERKAGRRRERGAVVAGGGSGWWLEL